MSGPLPSYRPLFPAAFVEQAQSLVRQRTHLRQRAQVVLLLEADPLLSNVRAAAEVHLHPNAVRYWRRRWALGEFCLVLRFRNVCRVTQLGVRTDRSPQALGS
jgi:Homeodomain-like domain